MVTVLGHSVKWLLTASVFHDLEIPRLSQVGSEGVDNTMSRTSSLRRIRNNMVNFDLTARKCRQNPYSLTIWFMKNEECSVSKGGEGGGGQKRILNR